MKIDFALRSLLVIDLWLAMSLITSIILEMTIIPSYNGIISISILAVSVIINLIICLGIINFKKSNKTINNK